MALQKTMGAPNLISKKVTSESIEAREYDQSLMQPPKSSKSGNISQTQCSSVNQTDVSTNNRVISSDSADKKFFPNFEFSVRSEKGINLVVDLNSSQLDWIKKLNDEVCIHQDMLNKKP